RRGRARRRPPLLRGRVLHPRQRRLPGLGRDLPRPRGVHRLAGAGPRGRGGDRAMSATPPGATPRVGEVGDVTADEVMEVNAARALAGARTCFVGIGLPSTAANLARRTVNPSLVLIYESGAIGAKPTRLPLSIGDGELADTADAVVSVPEMFNYWLQAGRIDVGFLGAAQIDRFGNINTTLIDRGPGRPPIRLPGAGGAPEIAANCREVLIVLRHSPRGFV